MPIKLSMINGTAPLDSIRMLQGNEQLKMKLHDLHGQDRENAVRLLNDDRLQYPSLYILQPEIIKLNIEPLLSDRNRLALNISGGLLRAGQPGAYQSKPEHLPVLQWMLQTGYKEENLGDEYDEIMDASAILLIKEHHDRDCLQPLEEMIFARHRRGLGTYDAEWAYFECRDPACLKRVAHRLLSPDPCDAALARRLLGFIPRHAKDPDSAAGQYHCAMQWIESNQPYLHYTGQSSQQSFNPCRFKIALENKYLQRPLPKSDLIEAAMKPPTDAGQPGTGTFAALDNGTKEVLSDYSHRLHAKSKAKWTKWMQLPLDKQINSARPGTGKEGLL